MPLKNNSGIYLVDDDPDDREIFSLALLDEGYKGPVIQFINGKKLLDHLVTSPSELPSLFILDLNMPVKNGVDTLRELKSKNLYQYIPVMILTSSSRESDESACWELGCEYYHTKPIEFSEYKKLATAAIEYADRNTGRAEKA